MNGTGWRYYWWTLRSDRKPPELQQDPEFVALVSELVADIRKQRQWYQENKDKPLSEIDLLVVSPPVLNVCLQEDQM